MKQFLILMLVLSTVSCNEKKKNPVIEKSNIAYWKNEGLVIDTITGKKEFKPYDIRLSTHDLNAEERLKMEHSPDIGHWVYIGSGNAQKITDYSENHEVIGTPYNHIFTVPNHFYIHSDTRKELVGLTINPEGEYFDLSELFPEILNY